MHTCSRAGCTQTAAHSIEWRNPRIHGPERKKVWLACDEHVEYLAEFLRSRSFPVAVFPLDAETSDTSHSTAPADATPDTTNGSK
ncbi:hypothetical protein FHX76_000683 [Lysinibacter cavernae]|uniref:Acetone carboxylase n=1 Tax=Lysinibacter cavernae TaxID=1640652 RepID=A0A7X5QZE1_9MICO|nr:hypothetical protein [Lysinibacter cavernae]